MENKNDWDELEKWQKRKEAEEIEKYGMKISEDDKIKGRKKVEKLSKNIRKIGISLRTLGIIILIIVCLIVGFVLYLINYNIQNRTNINAKKTVETMYNIKVKTIDEQLNEHKNKGKYIFETKEEPIIRFVAIKEYGSLKEDYNKKAKKYYYEKWNNENKKYFKINESEENGLLSYEIYVDLNDFDNFDDAVNKIIEFANFCGDNFEPWWNIYIKDNENRIYLYSLGTTPEEVLKNVKKRYNSFHEKNDLTNQ